MSDKLFLLILFLGWDFYFLLIAFLSFLSDRRPVPECVRDIASSEDFARRKTGHELSMKFLIKCMFAVSAVFIFLIVMELPKPWWDQILDSTLLTYAAGILFVTMGMFCFGLILRHFMMIREHYGTSRQKWRDIRKTYFLFSTAVIVLFILFFTWMRALLQNDLELEKRSLWMMLLIIVSGFACAAAIAVFLLYRRTEPLPDGKLADGVQELIRKSRIRHCSVRIKRITERRKINGACMKLPGRTVIFLHCCLEKEEDYDLILAVAGHELDHGVHNHLGWMIFLTALAFLPLILSNVIMDPVMLEPWFEKVYLLFLYQVFLPALILTVFLFKRRWESDADAFAVKLGYGEPAVQLFRIYLTEDDYEPLNPYPLLVAMICTHPPLSQRIAAIEKTSAKSAQAACEETKSE